MLIRRYHAGNVFVLDQQLRQRGLDLAHDAAPFVAPPSVLAG
jgi:hypothetical protein